MKWYFSGIHRYTVQPVENCNTLEGICDLEQELDRHLSRCPIKVLSLSISNDSLFFIFSIHSRKICQHSQYFKHYFSTFFSLSLSLSLSLSPFPSHLCILRLCLSLLIYIINACRSLSYIIMLY